MGDFWEDKTRKPIKISVKRQVYKRAKEKCEKCKKEKLSPPDTKGGFKGHYHHIRAPHISPTAKTVRLLCPNCHEKYGHSTKTVKRDDFYETTTVKKVKRHEVVKIKLNHSFFWFPTMSSVLGSVFLGFIDELSGI